MASVPDEDQDGQATEAATADTEGHSLALVMGIDAMGRRSGRERDRAGKPSDEELTPLTKPFPRLKDDARK